MQDKINITEKDIKNIIEKFEYKIIDKISNNTLKQHDFLSSIKLIDYKITLAISYIKLNQNGKYEINLNSVWPTEGYNRLYNKQKSNKDFRKIFVDELKH